MLHPAASTFYKAPSKSRGQLSLPLWPCTGLNKCFLKNYKAASTAGPYTRTLNSANTFALVSAHSHSNESYTFKIQMSPTARYMPDSVFIYIESFDLLPNACCHCSEWFCIIGLQSFPATTAIADVNDSLLGLPIKDK